MAAARALFLAIVGYCLAVAAAAAVTVAIVAVISREIFLEDVVAGWAIGCVWTFPMALPGFLVTLAVSIATGWRGAVFFGTAGALDALPAHGLMAEFVGSDPTGFGTLLVAASIPGGMAGGLVYWLVARRDLPRAASAPAVR